MSKTIDNKIYKQQIPTSDDVYASLSETYAIMSKENKQLIKTIVEKKYFFARLYSFPTKPDGSLDFDKKKPILVFDFEQEKIMNPEKHFYIARKIFQDFSNNLGYHC